MYNTVNFLIESGISLSLLATIYILFLRRETFFRLNRIFLLVSVAFSLLLPFLKFHIFTPQPEMLSEITVTPYRNLLEGVSVYSQSLTGSVEQSVSSSWIMVGVYLTGLLIFLGRFVYRILQIFRIIRKNEVEKENGIKYVLVAKEFSPFSFMRYIFINPAHRNEKAYWEMILHEKEHVTQGHTFDVLILEMMTILQWFNPFMWILKKVIRENHEYLADQAVLNAGASPAYYKQLLLHQAIGLQPVMANNFNSSLIKNRIKMISKIKSSKYANLKVVFGILTVLALTVIFACERKESVEPDLEVPGKIQLSFENEKLKIEGEPEEVEKLRDWLDSEGFTFRIEDGNLYMIPDNKEKSREIEGDVFFIVEDMPEFPGGELALRKFIGQNVKYPEEAQKNKIQGKVYVTFVVGKDGYVGNAQIARGVNPILDREALRVVNSMPKWKPGFQRGTPVNVSFTVPINFVLQ